MKLLQNKLTGDIAWTMGSLVVLAASGIVINLIIASFRDASSLGVFNQAYAVYIVASQIAVFGLHYSVLRHAALHKSDKVKRESLLVNAGFFTLMLGVFAAVIVYFSAPSLGKLFDSNGAALAMRNAAFGLMLFPLNKVLLAFLNGLRRMKAFSVLQSSRYILVMIWVAIISASQLPFEYVTYGFIIAEFATTCGVVIYLIYSDSQPSLRFDHSWTKRHFIFGSKSLLAGMFVELNSRVDVLLIGFFLPDREVGIYSFAAMLVDGLYHVLAVVRINFNPVLVTALKDSDWVGAQKLLRQTKRYLYPVAAVLSIAMLVVFWVLTEYIVPSKGLHEGLLPLAILLTGLTMISIFIPFDNLLLVSGHPGYQTIQHLTVVLSNIGLNAALIPVLGINGAAMATATSYFIGITVLVVLVRRMLRWNLITNIVTN